MRITALLLAAAASIGLCAEDAPVEAPAVPPFAFQKAQGFDVTRHETYNARLGERKLYYLDRGPAHIEMQVLLQADRDHPAQIGVRVPRYQYKGDSRGREETLEFDPTLLDEREDGRRLRVLRSNAGAADRETLRALTRDDWYRLTWSKGEWSHVEQTAAGEAWRPADRLALERVLPLILPPEAQGDLNKGQTFRRTVVLPYPVPLTPALTAEVQYRVEGLSRDGEKLIAEVTFASRERETSEEAHDISWGGIALEGIGRNFSLSGSLRVDLMSHRLLEAQLLLETVLAKRTGGEHFMAQWKLESRWQSTNP